MEPKEIAKQMIDFQKTTFDNTFNGLVMLQEQTGKVMSTFLEQNAAIPAQGKKVVDEWLTACKTYRDYFKKAVDENFKKVEELFAGAEKAQKPTAVKAH